jgi:O-antigen/teichoic acid export membrane protein
MPKRIVREIAARASQLHKSPFYRSVAWVAGGTAAAQAITVLSTPVVTRLYTPADYGVFAVCTAILGVIQPLATLTYAMAIPLADNGALARNLLKLCLAITLTTSLLMALVTLLFGEYIAAYFGIPLVEPYLWILPVCLFGAGCYESLSSWAVREKRFRLISATQVSQGVTSAAVKIGLGLIGVQPLGLLLGLLASNSAGSSSLFRKLLQEEPEVMKRFSWNEVAAAARRFRDFPLYRSWSRLILGFNVRLPVFLIAAAFDPVVAGLFGLANSMVDLPMTLVGNSVSKVFYSEIARYGKGRPDKILALSLSIMKKMSALGILAAAALMIAGPWMFALVFGVEWSEAGVYARWLSIGIMLRFVAAPVMHCLDVLEMQRTQLVINIARTATIVAAFLLARFWGYSPVHTIGLYAIVLALFYASVIVGVVWLLKRRVVLMEQET